MYLLILLLWPQRLPKEVEPLKIELINYHAGTDIYAYPGPYHNVHTRTARFDITFTGLQSSSNFLEYYMHNLGIYITIVIPEHREWINEI